MKKVDINIESIASLSLEEVTKLLDEYESNDHIGVEKAFRLNKRFRELKGYNHEGYVNRISKDYERITQSPVCTDTYKRFYTYLKKEITDGAEYIAIIDDDQTFQKMGKVELKELSDEEIDHLLSYFNGIPVLKEEDVFIPFDETPMSAVFLNEIYNMRKGHFHPTFVENALTILEPIVSHAETCYESGKYSSFSLETMCQSLRKINRLKNEKNGGTND